MQKGVYVHFRTRKSRFIYIYCFVVKLVLKLKLIYVAELENLSMNIDQ